MKFWQNAHKSSLLFVCVGRWEIGSEGGSKARACFHKVPLHVKQWVHIAYSKQIKAKKNFKSSLIRNHRMQVKVINYTF